MDYEEFKQKVLDKLNATDFKKTLEIADALLGREFNYDLVTEVLLQEAYKDKISVDDTAEALLMGLQEAFSYRFVKGRVKQ